MTDDERFRSFIQDQLKQALVNEKYREIFTDEEGLKVFRRAFTHPTHSSDNYEVLEFIGDGILKGVLSQYITDNVTYQHNNNRKGEGFYSKTRRYLEQSGTLTKFALKLGFWDHVLANDDVRATKRNKTLEDVFEAFLGAMVDVIDKRVKRGLGYNYAYNYVKPLLDETDLTMTEEMLDDPITRLNEVYKANELSSGFLLRWRDAIYNVVELFVPKLNSHPSTAEVGQVYYSDTNRSFYVYYNGGWVNVNDAPLIQLSPYPDLNPVFDEMGKQTNLQKVWYAGVYGYPSKIGKPYDGFLNGVTLEALKRDPQRYGAEIIGQGVNFKKNNARKKAAQEALDFLERRGVKK